MNVLSLFDGIGGARVALDRAGIVVNKYYTSEINKFADAIFTYNYPDHIKLGDIKNWHSWIIDWGKIDLIIGGSPCTNLSVAGRMEGLKGEQSRLFYDFVDILNFTKKKNPNVYFILENVVMKKEWEDTMTSFVGVEPIMIDSALVSAQRRRRLYWTNIPDVSLPKDRGIVLKDVLTGKVDKSRFLPKKYYNDIKWNNTRVKNNTIRLGQIGRGGQGQRIYSVEGKSVCLASSGGGWGAMTGMYKIDLLNSDYLIRKLMPIEAERLQIFPDDYTRYGVFDNEVKEVSKTQRLRALGNSFTVYVISHILSFLKSNSKLTLDKYIV